MFIDMSPTFSPHLAVTTAGCWSSAPTLAPKLGWEAVATLSVAWLVDGDETCWDVGMQKKDTLW